MINQDVTLANGNVVIHGAELSFEFPVAQAIPIGHILVIRMEVPSGVIRNDNIMAILKDGKELWKIEPTPHGGVADSPYVDLRQSEAGELVATNWNGVEYKVDKNSGKITLCNFRRF